MELREKSRVEFTKEMKKNYKILFPNMINIHFKIICNILRNYGYDAELLTNTDQSVIDEGLRYVNNDTCYPALITIGQMINALKSGKYDINKSALMMTQTGGGCRASNYIHLIRKALKNANMGQVPVISVNLSGLEKNSGFKMTLPLLRHMLVGIAYGDILMLLNNQTKPYEVNKGDSSKNVDKWVEFICNEFKNNRGFSEKDMKKHLVEIVKSFNKIKIKKVPKVKVGIVGEIYVKYSALANNNLETLLAKEDCEVMISGLLPFLLFKVDNRIEDIEIYGGNFIKENVAKILLKYFKKFESNIIDAIKDNSNFVAPAKYSHLKELVDPVIGHGCKMGEGWLLTSEMLELIELGYNNIVCVQPFGCLPNHIVAKGMIRKVTTIYPNANIVPVDYDPSATKVNQENRIKLMLSIARENLAK